MGGEDGADGKGRGGVSAVRSDWLGLGAWVLSDGSVRAVVVPEWGGKVAALVDVRRGREWMFMNPIIQPRRPEYGASYVRDFDIGGWDECFPTVGACSHPSPPWKGVVLPDHGEVWALPWDVEPMHEGLRVSVSGRTLPYRLTKTIKLVGGGRLRMEYCLENKSDSPMPFVWSSHPLINIRPGMMLSVPAKRMRVDASPSFPAKPGDVISWPRFGRFDLSTVPSPHTGLAVKLFTEDLEKGRVGLIDPEDGASIQFDFDPHLVTHVGLWLNYGGWAGVPGAKPYFNIGLEPCIGNGDSLEEVVRRGGPHGIIPAGGAVEWWIELTLS